jgi:hypothetical protein
VKKQKKLKKLTKKEIKRQNRISKRKALKEWSDSVRKRDDNFCQICGIKDGALTKNNKPVVLNSHHILAKEKSKSGDYSNLMFDINNGTLLCQNCHRFSRQCSAHRQEFAFFVWLMKNKPEQFEYLKTKLTSDKILNNSNKE